MTISLPPFPQPSSRVLPAPDMGYLLTMPFFDLAPLDFVLQRCATFQRILINNAPIKRDKKNILVSSRVQLLFPGYSPTINHNGETFEWHIDGQGTLTEVFEDPDRIHIYVSPCTSRTEFGTTVVPIPVHEINNDRLLLDKFVRENFLGLQTMQIEPERFYTFDTHLHRATDPQQIEFRFYFAIIESNKTEPYDRTTWMPNRSLIFRGNKTFINIEKVGEAIILNKPKGE